MNEGAVAAVDLGASSGRVIVGRVADGRVSLEEVHRFPNEPVQLDDGLYWDALRLHHEILTGLRRAARVAPDLRSIGIDTWGVDVGMLDEAGALVGNPVHHRDPRNLPAVERRPRADPAGRPLRAHRPPVHADQHAVPARGGPASRRRSRSCGGSCRCPTCSATG